jgi:hypothetical protein
MVPRYKNVFAFEKEYPLKGPSSQVFVSDHNKQKIPHAFYYILLKPIVKAPAWDTGWLNRRSAQKQVLFLPLL